MTTSGASWPIYVSLFGGDGWIVCEVKQAPVQDRPKASAAMRTNPLEFVFLRIKKSRDELVRTNPHPAYD
jgi:hypothetical protein